MDSGNVLLNYCASPSVILPFSMETLSDAVTVSFTSAAASTSVFATRQDEGVVVPFMEMSYYGFEPSGDKLALARVMLRKK